MSEVRDLQSGPDTMRRIVSSALIASALFTACAVDDSEGDEDLGDIGDGKADSFGIVDKAATISAGKSRSFSFTANASFRIAVTQPDTDPADRPELESTLTKPDASTQALTK